jgi:hypothetical protein
MKAGLFIILKWMMSFPLQSKPSYPARELQLLTGFGMKNPKNEQPEDNHSTPLYLVAAYAEKSDRMCRYEGGSSLLG